VKRKPICIYLILIFLLLLSFGGCANNKASDNSDESSKPVEATGFTHTPKPIETASQSVLKLTTYNSKGNLVATGSGVSIFEKGVFVTSAHVLVNMEYVIAEDENGREYRFEFSDIKAENEEYDIAVILVPELEVEPLPYTTEPLQRGEAVATIGSQFGILNMVTTGVVSGIWETERMKLILFTAPVSAGASGGAVFNDSGQVLGIIIGTYNNSQNINIATPVTEAEKLYESYIKGEKK